MGDAHETSRLQRVAELFAAHGVEFLVIGGRAESLFGSPRVTHDIDRCHRHTSDNLQRLAEALKELKPTLRGFPPDLPFRIDAHALALGTNFTFKTVEGDLDLLAWVEPIGRYEDLVKNAESYPVGNVIVRTISLDDLIRVKEHIRRPKDRDSLFQLKAIKRIREETGGR